MTPLFKFLKKTKERLFGVWYEGPDPPLRLAEMAIAFSNAHPRATRREWLQFAIGHAGESYRSGYVRGHDWAERDLEARPDVPPEVVADMADPDWRWREAIQVEGDLTEVVPEDWPEELVMAEQLDALGRGIRQP